MEHLNTQTFRHSELPPFDDAMKGEIAEIDFNVSNLLLKIQGNYRALSALHETLSDLLDSCDMNISCIRIIPDGNEDEGAPRAIGLTDLPKEEKRVILSTAITSTVALQVLAGIFDCDFEQAAHHIRTISQAKFGQMSLEEIEIAIEELSKTVRENPKGGSFCIQV